jgi:hypothetical protein
MMLSPLINGRPATRYSCRFAAGSDGTRIISLDWTPTPQSDRPSRAPHVSTHANLGPSS